MLLFVKMLTFLTIVNLKSWQSLWPENKSWHNFLQCLKTQFVVNCVQNTPTMDSSNSVRGWATCWLHWAQNWVEVGSPQFWWYHYNLKMEGNEIKLNCSKAPGETPLSSSSTDIEVNGNWYWCYYWYIVGIYRVFFLLSTPPKSSKYKKVNLG